MSDAAKAGGVAKETKAQRSERLKLEKNPWAAWDEVRTFAREGRGSVLPEWAEFYFKWWGVYTQGDGAGVTGGVGGVGKATEYFMMRIGLPNGLLTAEQLHTIADITEKYARGVADITTRQNIQLHWLTIEALPEVVDALTAVGLSPKGACGDVVRNVTGCPLAGLDGHEVLDASPLAVEVAHLLTANPEFYNLPRKFKISVTGCPIWCSYPEINDVGLTGLKRVKDGVEEVGYSLRVGGGLSAEPHLAVRLNAFVPQDKALAAVKAVCEIFREQEVLRESRTHARLKYLFMRHGWTAETMLAAIEEKIGFQVRSLRRGADCGGCVSRSRGRAQAAAGGAELCRRDGAEWAIESGTAACAGGAERRVWRWASARDDWAEYCAGEYSECEDAGGCRED